MIFFFWGRDLEWVEVGDATKCDGRGRGGWQGWTRAGLGLGWTGTRLGFGQGWEQGVVGNTLYSQVVA